MRPTAVVRPEDRTVLIAGVTAIAGIPLLLVAANGRLPTGPGSAGLVAALLFAASIPALAQIARRDGDASLLLFLTVALAAKLAGAFARYYVTSAAYGGLADAARYDDAGRSWVAAVRSGHPVLIPETLGPFSAGTRALGTITGVVYGLFGRNLLTGFVVFSWLGFWGLVMAYRAFRIGLPDGDHRRYRLLLFFLPSLVFWPSSIGKDAWMQFTLGAAFLGTAELTRAAPRLVGVAWLVLGVGLAAVVRPQIALAAVAPLAVALAWRSSPTGDRTGAGRHAAVRMAGLIVLGLGSLLLLNRMGTVLGGDGGESGGIEAVGGVLDRASNITATGGSQFEATAATGITDLPGATFSVLFRPFIWEVNSVVRLHAAFDTTLLMILVVVSRNRLKTIPSLMRRNRFVVYLVVFTLVSIVGFSRVGNEGILARQRTQFLPSLIALLCVPAAVAKVPDPDRQRVAAQSAQ